MDLMGHHAESVVDEVGYSTLDRLKHWARYEAPWFMASLTGHVVVLLALLLILGNIVPKRKYTEAPPEIDEANVPAQVEVKPLEHFEVGETPEDPTVLDTESLTMAEAPHAATIEENNSDDKEFEHKGGGVVNGSANSLGGAGGFD
ncbi:MAG TPA: hypothetical protein VFE24_17045, partial [Pirellulales bacterium]|nr:hypothetical protein [Pirellulales bacterium]